MMLPVGAKALITGVVILYLWHGVIHRVTATAYDKLFNFGPAAIYTSLWFSVSNKTVYDWRDGDTVIIVQCITSNVTDAWSPFRSYY